MRFCDGSKLVSDKIGCKKTIFDVNTNKYCNRFQKLEYITTDFYEMVRSSLEIGGFFQCPDRFFFVCPIGFFLDHINEDSLFVATKFLQINELFTRTGREIAIVHQEVNHLTIHPHELRFNLTNQCNLRCRYCYVNFDNQKISSEEIIRMIQYYLEQEKSPKILSFFGGEPLLEYKTLEYVIPTILALYAKYNISAPIFRIATNALLLDNEKMKFLDQYEFEIHITSGGTSEQCNDLRD